MNMEQFNVESRRWAMGNLCPMFPALACRKSTIVCGLVFDDEE
jgi:hypothetical protein